MSDSTIESLIERVAEVKYFFEGTDLETALDNNIEANDWEKVRELVVNAEAEISRQEFHNNDMVDHVH